MEFKTVFMPLAFFCFVAAAPTFFYIPCDDIWQVGTIGAEGDQRVAQTKNSIQET